MEVLPCSSVQQYVGETNSLQQSSGTTLTYDGQPSSLEHGKQVQVLDGLVLNIKGPNLERQGDVSYFDAKLEGQTSSTTTRDFEDDESTTLKFTKCDEPCMAFANSDIIVNIIESDIQEGEVVSPEPEGFGRDESMALWVKWKGKWQAGIRCVMDDCPLSILKAKPTHDRKKYIVIFFPHTENYAWADVQIVSSINAFPQPIAYESHDVGREMVKDMTVAHRFILQKLAIGMLNIIDQMNIEAFKETAHDVRVWKEFAMEASRCNNYPDLGRMLPKLQNMISHHCIQIDWLQNSFHSWLQQCQNAHSAQSVEFLKEELTNCIIWKEIKPTGEAPVHPKLGSERKIWKQEVMKWFSTSHPISPNNGHTEPEQQSGTGPMPMKRPKLEISRKRPKLEIRRAEPHASHVEPISHQNIIIDSETGFFDNQENKEAAPLFSEPCKNDFMEGVALSDKWGEIVVQAENVESAHNQNVELTPISEIKTRKTLDNASKNRQCIAFIESKGRQCVRFANEGDVYCCVHLASRFVGNSTRGEETPPLDTPPMCGGTTTLGTKCKHRSLPGYIFCKKHRPHNLNLTLDSTQKSLKRKHEEIMSSTETHFGKELVLFQEIQSPLHVEPLSVMDGYSVIGANSNNNNADMPHCIGSCMQDENTPCFESSKRHSLYCEKHLPSWLKRARNGKSRILSKEVFLDLLSGCSSQQQKIHLHQACELFYRLLKSIMSLRNQVPREIQLQWALSEASKNVGVGEFLFKLVCNEKERLNTLWGLGTDNNNDQVSLNVKEDLPVMPFAILAGHETENTIKCKICSVEFVDDQTFGSHFLENHKKETKWLFRGYACAICLDSFTNKKNMETHVQERHHVDFTRKSMLIKCILCSSHFGNTDELWSHVLSSHSVDFRPSSVSGHNNRQSLELMNSPSVENNNESQDLSRRFICRFCGLKFDLLPDLGRHHQEAHMGPNLFHSSSRPPKKGIRYYAYRSKSGRLSRPRFRKGLAAASYRIRNRASENIKKRLQASRAVIANGLNVESDVILKTNLGRLAEPQCLSVAKTLFSEIQKTKARPSNVDILSVARATCCKVNLHVLLEQKYGVLPERLYLRAAKLCGEHEINVEWHVNDFVCPKGCNSLVDQHIRTSMIPISNKFVGNNKSSHSLESVIEEWEMDESHCIIDSSHFSQKFKGNILCKDISFGRESISITCVLNDTVSMVDSDADGQSIECSKPWESFTYVTKSLVDQSVGIDMKSLQLGCACRHLTCSPEICDHVYLFDNDYEDAKDIYGKPINGRFPYDDKGRIILEEGCLVYECNSMCRCRRSCPNRVLQNGVRVKLEVFETERKGWGVRAGGSIMRGTFVCEYIGEVLDEEEANTRHNRYGREECNYFYKIHALNNPMNRFLEEKIAYVIDATKYGNVSRFVNHSCSPNLMGYQVLVDSMELQRAHIGFYASRDIAAGEELTYDYQYEILPGDGRPCHCGASNCRGRLC